jgi:hypothetical protein
MLLNSVPGAMGKIPAPMRKINAPHSEKRPAPKRRACLDQTTTTTDSSIDIDYMPPGAAAVSP